MKADLRIFVKGNSRLDEVGKNADPRDTWFLGREATRPGAKVA